MYLTNKQHINIITKIHILTKAMEKMFCYSVLYFLVEYSKIPTKWRLYALFDTGLALHFHSEIQALFKHYSSKKIDFQGPDLPELPLNYNYFRYYSTQQLLKTPSVDSLI